MIDSDGKRVLENIETRVSNIHKKIVSLSNTRMDFLGLPARLGDSLEVGAKIVSTVITGFDSGAFPACLEAGEEIYSKYVVEKQKNEKEIKFGQKLFNVEKRENIKEKSILRVATKIPIFMSASSIDAIETSKEAHAIYAQTGSASTAILTSLVKPLVTMLSLYTIEHWNQSGKKQQDSSTRSSQTPKQELSNLSR